MKKDRVIVEIERADEAKKVEETVKTGYIETAIENLVQWIGVEDDLADSYVRLATSTSDSSSQKAYRRLADESESVSIQLSDLLKSFDALNAARVRRIELLDGL